MKIIWLSTNEFGYELLKEAITIDGLNIEAIIILSDNAKTLIYDSIKPELWYDFDIKVYKIINLNDETELLKKLSPDLVVMCGWRQIVDKKILLIPKNGFVGFHPSLLPKGRGPAPIINTILEGVKTSGLTFYHVSEGLDNGDIIGQEKFEILDTDHAEDVYNKVITAGKKLIKTYLPLLIKGKAPRIPQNDSDATYLPRISLKNNHIDIEKESIEEIYNKIRALSKPYKGAYIKKNGKKLIIWKAELEE